MPYSNGHVEGNNRKIKVLKHTAYGYKKFSNFRNRILLIFLPTLVVIEAKKEAPVLETGISFLYYYKVGMISYSVTSKMLSS